MTQTSDLGAAPLLRWRDVRLYGLVMLLFWLASAALLWAKGYHGGFKWANQFQQEQLGYASLYLLTHLGDGVIMPMMMVLFFWRRDPALVITGVVAMLATGLITQGLKLSLFEDWMRPPTVFANDPEVHIFQPKPIHRHSFPSGHATSIASGGLMFAFFWGRRWPWLQVLVGCFTLLLCYTRVLLGVHFPGDIFVGSIIGTMGAGALLAWLYPVLHRWSMRWALAGRGRLALVVMALSVVAGVVQYILLLRRI